MDVSVALLRSASCVKPLREKLLSHYCDDCGRFWGQTGMMGTNAAYYGAGTVNVCTNIALSDIYWPWKQLPIVSDGSWSTRASVFLLLEPGFPEYQGSFQSCFHFSDSYRMEQTVAGVHIPGDSHVYASQQHNGFHMSTANAGSAGEYVLAPVSQSVSESVSPGRSDRLCVSSVPQASAWPRSCKETQAASSRPAQRRAFTFRSAASTAAWATCPQSTPRHRATLEQDALHHLPDHSTVQQASVVLLQFSFSSKTQNTQWIKTVDSKLSLFKTE